MSTETKVQDTEYECGMCGRNGGPIEACDLCKGSKRFLQERHYTLSEERSGLNSKEREARYGRYGAVMPKVVNLPGSANPMQS